MRCCLCHELGVEIHHIIPQEEDGPDSEDNAASLCPTCHERYGANPTKRKFIREARDNWYSICDRRYASDPDQIAELYNLLSNHLASQPPSNATNESTIAEILGWLYGLDVSTRNVTPKQVEFVYEFLFGGSLGEEYDQIKGRFSVGTNRVHRSRRRLRFCSFPCFGSHRLFF